MKSHDQRIERLEDEMARMRSDLLLIKRKLDLVKLPRIKLKKRS